MAKSVKAAELSKKAGQGLVKTGTFIKANWMPLLYVGGAVLAIVAVKKVLDIFDFDGLKEAQEEAQENQAGGKNFTMMGTPNDESSPTISKGQANTIAQNQYNAMYDVGTDEIALVNSLKPLNGADLRLVYFEYASPVYSVFGTLPFFGAPLDLFGWYNKELGSNSGTIKELRSIWMKSGLPITF
jgi:hypothetical protein